MPGSCTQQASGTHLALPTGDAAAEHQTRCWAALNMCKQPCCLHQHQQLMLSVVMWQQLLSKLSLATQ
jgi:hypothetical protein